MTLLGWRGLLDAMVRGGRRNTYPLLVFEAKAPLAQEWPASLPRFTALEEFYQLCDGGYLAHFNIASLSQVVEWTGWWVGTMRGWRDGTDVLDPTRHVVFGNDAGGCPLILDSTSGEVRTFQIDGGDWEPGWPSLESFLHWLFVDAGPEDWTQAMAELAAGETRHELNREAAEQEDGADERRSD